MKDETRLILAFIAGVVLAFAACLLVAVFVDPFPADAQSVGLFETAATGARTNCTQITSPVTGQTWCFDAISSTIQVWNGTTYATVSLSNVGGPPTCTDKCGTSATVVGTNTAMRVTMGSTGTPRSPFLVLFTAPWNSPPSCVAQLMTATTTTVSVTNSSTTGVQVNTVIGPSQGAVYSILCLGVGG